MGENSYLVVWPIEDIISLNEAYDVRDEAKSIIEIPFESIHIEDANICANNFNDFIKNLYQD